jgi:hypothetical protein
MSQNPGFKPLDDLVLDELEESIPQGVPNDTGMRRRLDDEQEQPDALDMLLAESVTAVEAETQYKRDRAAKAKGFTGLSKEEVEFCNSRMAAFEMAREWDADRAIGIYSKFSCAQCGRYSLVFSRYMEHHKHRRNPTAFRWITVREPAAQFQDDLELVREDRTVATCEDCDGVAGQEDEMMELKEVLK